MDAIGAAAALPDRLRSLLFNEFAQIAPGRAHPAEFRLNSYRVQISRTPEGDLLVHPCPSQRGQALMLALSGFDADFVFALEQQQADKLPVQEREEL